MEGAVAHAGEEILPLHLVVIGVAWGIADDAEAEERNLQQIAGLRDGSALHVAGKAVDEMALDDVLPVAVGNKLVAGADQASL